MDGGPTQAELEALAGQVAAALLASGQTLASAESCTGGWLGQVLTAIAGSSLWYERGFITYSNAAKSEDLGVPGELLARHGAVSEEAARAMAAGVLAGSPADWALAITGIAGPSGGSPDKPVGTVCFAWGRRGTLPTSETRCFAGDRRAVRAQAVAVALQGLLARLAALSDH
jgi:nicotinamide-nucleotide amidase